MTSRLPVLALLGLAACSFPSEGVPLGDDVPDAETAPDACVPVDEACDGADNDCDGNFDEGFASGAPCDGPDDDLCLDDMMVCGDGGGEVCGDTSGDDNVELCNGPDLDEDCDGMTDEGYALVACDGGDTDVCSEGVNICAPDGLGVVCNDATGNNVELCDEIDQDCDGSNTNGFDLAGDEANCGDCGVACSNPNGTTTCTTGDCVPTCSNGAAQCNGDPYDGCELVDTSPSCAAATAVEFTINGDVSGDSDGDGDSDSEAVTTGTTERFIRVRIRELTGAGLIRAITARFTLASGAGTDWDLFVYCKADCDAATQSSPGDVVSVGRSETSGVVNMEVIVEVRYDPSTPSTTCAPWTLTMEGNTGGNSTCGD